MTALSPTVFIVDDDAAVRNSLRLLVKSVGLTAAVFASAQEFLGSYDPQQPGCLALDVRDITIRMIPDGGEGLVRLSTIGSPWQGVQPVADEHAASFRYRGAVSLRLPRPPVHLVSDRASVP
ncbi:MAG: response regulator [Gammaproteobacteria bacterium]|nr:MAG: response regulator [Gammaproteobacteria bacterium]